MKYTYLMLLLIFLWSCQDKSKFKTTDRFEYDREISKLKSLTHVTHYFDHYAALGVDNLSSSLCAAFKAA